MKKYLSLIFLVLVFNTYAQDDLLEMLEEEQQTSGPQLVEATFKGTRLINGHSVKTRKAGTLDFIISHRFGLLSSGAYNLWGLDHSDIRLGLEYAPTDRLYLGVGRNSFEKTFDGFIKYRLIRQQTGSRKVPVSITGFTSMAIETLRNTAVETSFSDKLAFTGQLLIARKVTSDLSLQVMPTFIHINLVNPDFTENTGYAIGVGGRYKLTQRFSVNAEYYYQVKALSDLTENAIAIGVDIETGGHVFQLQLTNANAMIAKGFVSETTWDFFSGDIHFGFNISRTFHLKD